MRLLPYDSATLRALAGDYNAATWPAQAVAPALCLLLLALDARRLHAGLMLIPALWSLWALAWNGSLAAPERMVLPLLGLVAVVVLAIARHRLRPHGTGR